MLKKSFLTFILASVFIGFVLSQENESEISEEEEISDVILVTATPVAENRQVFEKEDLDKLHIEDLPSLLREAGVQVLSYGAYGLEQKPSIRGFTDETVRVVIDGVCMNNAQYGTFDFSTLNLASVEKIEIVRGGFTEGIEDEGAVGGVIYITTKKESDGRHFYSDSSVKTFLAMGIPVDTISQKLGFNGRLGENTFLKADAAGTFAQNKYIYKTSDDKYKKMKNSTVIDGGADASFTHYFLEKNYFTVQDIFYAGKKKCPGTEYSANPGLQKDFNNVLSFSISFPEVADSVTFDSSLVWTNTRRYYDDETDESSRHYINDFKLTSSADFFKWNWLRQTAGISVQYTHLNSTDDGKHNQFSGVIKETSKIYFNDIFSLSIPLAWKFCGKNAEFVPKAGVSADFGFVEIVANGYRMIQFPNMDDMYWESIGYSGNPDLKCEKGWGAEAAVTTRTGILPFNVCVFTNWYENKIQWTYKNGKWQTQNVASAWYFGVDFGISQSFFSDTLILSANGEYLYNELRDKSNKSTYKKRIMWTPDWTGTASTKLNLKWFDFSASLQYVGKRYLSNANTSYLDPYFLLGASLNLKLWEHVKPYFRGENLLNKRYYSIENYAQPGISLAAGVKIEF